jgi:hypothetical protein
MISSYSEVFGLFAGTGSISDSGTVRGGQIPPEESPLLLLAHLKSIL